MGVNEQWSELSIYVFSNFAFISVKLFLPSKQAAWMAKLRAQSWGMRSVKLRSLQVGVLDRVSTGPSHPHQPEHSRLASLKILRRSIGIPEGSCSPLSPDTHRGNP